MAALLSLPLSLATIPLSSFLPTGSSRFPLHSAAVFLVHFRCRFAVFRLRFTYFLSPAELLSAI